MTALIWDQVGERTYQTGVDRGVLYLPSGLGVAWNGITSVEETSNRDVKSFYLDGVKYLESHHPGDFVGRLQALTYPDEFDDINGVRTDGDGMFFHNQNPKSFGLSYRTLIGDDVVGLDLGYKLHIFYNLMANPDSIAYGSLSEQISPSTFGWTLSGTPVVVAGRRPTAHVSIDSRVVYPQALAVIEAALYGTSSYEAELPPLEDLMALLNVQTNITITDNGDGTWTADGPDHLITMISSTSFQIAGANATYLDANTYEISSTEES